MEHPHTQERLSPDEKYKLLIKPRKTGERTWDTLDIEIRRVIDDTLIGTTTRNYPGSDILHFVSQDSVDYLVLSENYHGGYGVMNLITGEKAHYDPQPTQKDKYEPFWCWAEPVAHDPEARTLTISGCYWAAPYEHITFDFSTPMSPPYPILEIKDEPYDPSEFEDEDEDEVDD